MPWEIKMKEIYRVNYANEKHHKEQLRQQIDPRVIETIEVGQNPSLNYKNAFKAVYYDQLEKTIRFQEEKIMRDKQNLQHLPVTQLSQSSLYRNPSSPNLKPSLIPLQTLGKNGQTLEIREAGGSFFKDYDQQRRKRFDQYIEGGLDGGHSFFRAQDQYQRRKEEQSKMMKYGLMEQLQMKENRKMQDYQARSQQVQAVRENRRRQVEAELLNAQRQRQQQLMMGEEIRQQAEDQRLRRNHKSYFQMSRVGRHNPITNPIEYHIDNPYILQKYTLKEKNGAAGRQDQSYQQ